MRGSRRCRRAGTSRESAASSAPFSRWSSVEPRSDEHQPEQPLQREQPFGEWIAGLAIVPLGGRQVEGVDVVRRRAGEADVLAADGLADAPVLVLGVDHVVLDAEHQRPQRLDLAGVGLAGAALREDDLVGVLQVAAEGVEDDQRVVVDVDAVEDAALHREVAGRERDHRRGARRVEVAAAAEVVLAGGQAGEQAGQHLVERGPRRGEHPAQRRLDAARQFVQRAGLRRAQAEVEARREDALLAALQGVAQALDILVGDLALGAGDLAASGVEHPRGLELDQLVRQLADRRRRVQRLQVQADVERRIEVDQPPKPVGMDVARVLGERQDPHVLAVDDDVRAAGLDRSGRDRVDDGPRPREKSWSEREGFEPLRWPP